MSLYLYSVGLMRSASEDALMSATSDVTDSLRQTMSMMQQELDRSVLSNQMLGTYYLSLLDFS